MDPPADDAGEVILYRTEDGRSEIQLRAADGTVWLTQLELAELFATSKQNVSLHIKNVFDEGELSERAVVKESLTTATDSKRYRTKRFSLPVGADSEAPLVDDREKKGSDNGD